MKRYIRASEGNKVKYLLAPDVIIDEITIKSVKTNKIKELSDGEITVEFIYFYQGSASDTSSVTITFPIKTLGKELFKVDFLGLDKYRNSSFVRNLKDSFAQVVREEYYK